jgi:hypothetical protein
MHLFGDDKGPHMVHFHARRELDFVELSWDVRNAPGELRWRVLRSESEFAIDAQTLSGSGQTLVAEGTDTYLMDKEVVRRRPYFYTVFLQDGDGAWELQVKVKVTHLDRLGWLHPSEGGPAEYGDYDHTGDLEREYERSILRVQHAGFGAQMPPTGH